MDNKGSQNTEKNRETDRIQRTKVMESVRGEISLKGGQLSDEEVLAMIENTVFYDSQLSMHTVVSQRELIQKVFYRLRKDLDILQPYGEDGAVSEIMVNGKDNIFIERNGHIEKVDAYFDEEEDLEEVMRRICAKVHREINELSPVVDARLSDGSRINAVYKNVAISGPTLTIRKFPEKAITMEALIFNETISKEVADFLKKMVEGGMNTLISGGTSSGKTTFLNVLSDYIPKNERVIVIEDSAELQIRGIENLVRLECRNANVQGKGQIDMQQLIKASLRMRPDRIIVGEIRGKEVVDMLQAMNTGHDGSLCTGHANSIEGMLRRMEAMFLQAANFPMEAIRSQIVEGIDLLVHLGRLPDKSRKVLEIAEIVGLKEGQIQISTLFKYSTERGLVRTENPLHNTEKLALRGVVL